MSIRRKGVGRKARRFSVSTPDPEPEVDFPPGTCISCWQPRKYFPKNQLPNTSPRFPLCAECLYYTKLTEERYGSQRAVA